MAPHVRLIGECNWTSETSAKLLRTELFVPLVPDSIDDMKYKLVWKPLRRSLGFGTYSVCQCLNV